MPFTINATTAKQPLFPLGQLLATPGVLAHCDRNGILILPYVLRHQCGDWGEVGAEDWQANDTALRHGGRLLSTYTVASEKIWIISEADRSSTTALFPSEY